LGTVEVGPRSAGSEPGPACYGRGGLEPTVTDADAVLGLIDPATFAGGSVAMDIAAARRALASVGGALGVSDAMAAFAVHEMVCESMASAARVHAIEKGKTIADHTLIAFGGAAPLHVARVAEKTGVQRVLVPPNAGVGSAVGFLRAPIAYEVVRSRHEVLDQLALEGVSDMLGEMSTEARTVVEQGAQQAPVQARRLAYMRYVGQGHEIAIALPDRRLVESDIAALASAYEDAYVRLFNRAIPGAQVEILSWSVLVSTVAPARPAPAATRPTETVSPPSVFRTCFDGANNRAIDVPVFRRSALRQGELIKGPALITEDETTTYVSASFDAHIDAQHNIVMDRKHNMGVLA
jgi:N-methylhydantoinase A